MLAHCRAASCLLCIRAELQAALSTDTSAALRGICLGSGTRGPDQQRVQALFSNGLVMGFLDDCPLKLPAEVPVSLGVRFDFAAVRYSAGDMTGKIHRRHIQYLSSQMSQSSKERLCLV